MPNSEIKVGDTVRSFDFEFVDNCYIEGKVIDFHFIEGCERCMIELDKKIFNGKDTTEDYLKQVNGDRLVYPPINGTPSWMGDVLNNIKKI